MGVLLSLPLLAVPSMGTVCPFLLSLLLAVARSSVPPGIQYLCRNIHALIRSIGSVLSCQLLWSSDMLHGLQYVWQVW